MPAVAACWVCFSCIRPARFCLPPTHQSAASRLAGGAGAVGQWRGSRAGRRREQQQQCGAWPGAPSARAAVLGVHRAGRTAALPPRPAGRRRAGAQPPARVQRHLQPGAVPGGGLLPGTGAGWHQDQAVCGWRDLCAGGGACQRAAHQSIGCCAAARAASPASADARHRMHSSWDAGNAGHTHPLHLVNITEASAPMAAALLLATPGCRLGSRSAAATCSSSSPLRRPSTTT